MRRVLERKHYTSVSDSEDVLSAVRTELIQQLLLLREGEKPEPIASFRAYVGAVTYGTWAEHLRRAHPARPMLLDRLRYLLENRTQRHGFALWSGELGERWCGLSCWRTTTRYSLSHELQWLVLDSAAAAGQVFAGANYTAMPLAVLVTALFDWLDQPIPLRQLVEVLGELLGISDRRDSLDRPGERPEENAPNEFADPAPSPFDALKWNEYLCWLWEETARLSLPQRSAFLLHSPALREFELAGLGSIRQVAALFVIAGQGIWRASGPISRSTIARSVRTSAGSASR